MRQLHAVPGCVSDAGVPAALRAGRTAVHVISHARTPWTDSRGPGCGHGGTRRLVAIFARDVCPWNRKAPITRLAAFQPRHISTTTDDGIAKETSLFAPELEWLASLSQQEFSAAFRGSAVKRAKWRGLVRNACVALGNSKLAPGSAAHARVWKLLKRLASGEDELIADHARWALARIGADGVSSVP